jgi:RNAse (barnase) inhibitor barstar
MSGLAGIVAGHISPGVYRWHAAFDAPEVQHAVEHAGWRFGYVDGWHEQSTAEFLTAVSATLEFPEHFGHNFDALGDCLSDLAEPTVLLWDGWAPLARADEDAFVTVVRLMSDRAGSAPPFAALLRGEGPEVDVPSLD